MMEAAGLVAADEREQRVAAVFVLGDLEAAFVELVEGRGLVVEVLAGALEAVLEVPAAERVVREAGGDGLAGAGLDQEVAGVVRVLLGAGRGGLGKEIAVGIVGEGRVVRRSDRVGDGAEAVDGVEDRALVGHDDRGRVAQDLAGAVADGVVLVRGGVAARVGDGLEAVQRVVRVGRELGRAAVGLDLGEAVAVRVVGVLVRREHVGVAADEDAGQAVGAVVLVRGDGAVGLGDGAQQAVGPVLIRRDVLVGQALVGGDALEAGAAVVFVEGDAAEGVGRGPALAVVVVGVADGRGAAVLQRDGLGLDAVERVVGALGDARVRRQARKRRGARGVVGEGRLGRISPRERIGCAGQGLQDDGSRQ